MGIKQYYVCVQKDEPVLSLCAIQELKLTDTAANSSRNLARNIFVQINKKLKRTVIKEFRHR